MIVNNAHLLTGWPPSPIVEGALIAIEKKSVIDFGKVGKLVDRYEDSEVLDVAGRLVLPGMIDAHTRPSHWLALGSPVPLTDELRLEQALDEEALYWSALVSFLDAVRAGVTTVVASISSPAAIEGSLEAVGRALEEVGIRGALSYIVSPRSATKLAIREILRRAEKCRGGASEWTQVFFGLEASSALDEDVLAKVVEAAEGTGAPFVVLLHEAGLARNLERAGTWKRGGIAVPRQGLTAEDEVVLAEARVYVVHSPQSDAALLAPSYDLRKEASTGLLIALGTAGCGASLMDEFRLACFRQRERATDFQDALSLAHRAAFVANPDLATRTFGTELGRIKPGARADLVVLDHRPSMPLEERNLADHLFWNAARAAVRSVVVNGRLLYDKGDFAGLDEARIRARAREAARNLWDRL
jgi:cytosine/adenosine deaminase-related metal-dependent hydrolase